MFTADELNRPEQADPVIRRVIGHARQLIGCGSRELTGVQFSSVRLL